MPIPLLNYILKLLPVKGFSVLGKLSCFSPFKEAKWPTGQSHLAMWKAASYP